MYVAALGSNTTDTTQIKRRKISVVADLAVKLEISIPRREKAEMYTSEERKISKNLAQSDELKSTDGESRIVINPKRSPATKRKVIESMPPIYFPRSSVLLGIELESVNVSVPRSFSPEIVL